MPEQYFAANFQTPDFCKINPVFAAIASDAEKHRHQKVCMNVASKNVIATTWSQYINQLDDDKSVTWLTMAGGFSLSNAKTEFELLALAQTAPNNLLFGLAHGKFADALAYPARHDLDMAFSKTSPIHSAFARSVLHRGRDLIAQSSLSHPHFLMTVRGSTENIDVLLKQVSDAPDEYFLGNVTSWLLTALQNQSS